LNAEALVSNRDFYIERRKAEWLEDAGWKRKGQFAMGGKVPPIYGPSGDSR